MSILSALLFALLFARIAHAQPVRTPLRTTLLQFALGAGSSTGGDYEERDEYTAEFMLAQPLRANSTRGATVGLVAGKTFVNGSDLTCRPRADRSCTPIMPRFGYASAMVGLEAIGAFGTASVALGPGVAVNDSSRLHPTVQYRADYSTPPLLHVALAASSRGIVVTGVDGSTVLLRSVTFGIRLR